MRQNRIYTIWRRTFPAGDVCAVKRLCGIYSPRQLQNIIENEKARSDRHGTALSLLVYDLSPLAQQEMPRFIASLLKTVRRTDHVGWIEKSAVGVVLPFSSKAGAQAFLDHCWSEDRLPRVSVQVYTYPDQWLSRSPETDNDGSERGNDGTRAARSPIDASRLDRMAFVEMPPIWKRTIDIVGAMAGLLLASPIMALTAAFIKLVSPGPVMYRQSRVGIGRREFVFFKFRTMHVATTDSSHADYVRQLIAGNQTMEKLDEKDPRIIRGGSVIRKTCIDELPQLYNILRGDMSLVGPRPCIPYEADEYLRWHAERFSVLPGLTGLWQVSGKNRLTFEQMIRLDITYQNRMSPWLDLWIILLTIPTVLGLVLDAVHRKLGSVGSTATVTTDTVVHLSSRQG